MTQILNSSHVSLDFALLLVVRLGFGESSGDFRPQRRRGLLMRSGSTGAVSHVPCDARNQPFEFVISVQDGSSRNFEQPFALKIEPPPQRIVASEDALERLGL
jgi:hypothetical protein